MRLTVLQFITLDGVTQGPGAPDEDTSDGFTAGGWLVPHLDDTFGTAVAQWVSRADALLLGRRTYQAFAQDWPQIDPADEPLSTAMNGLPKHVATRGAVDTTWEPVTVLAGDDVAQQVAALKERPGGELQVHGSTTLARSLLTAGLVDELRLVVAPVVVGSGRRLFPEGSPMTAFEVRRHDLTPRGLAIQELAPVGEGEVGTYAPGA